MTSKILEENDMLSVLTIFYKVTSLCATIGDLFFAGAETTSTTLSWSMLYLAVNPSVQKKLQTEIETVVGKSRQVSLSDKPNLPYVEATINEVLRQSSIVVTGVFHTALEDAKFRGYDVPKGSWLVANQHAIHHNKGKFQILDKYRGKIIERCSKFAHNFCRSVG